MAANFPKREVRPERAIGERARDSRWLPTGASMGAQQPRWGSTTTGNRVADGTMFYLQDGGTTLATVRVRVRQG